MAKRRSSRSDPARAFAAAAARAAEETNAEDISVLDLRGRSPVTDYFVICTGTSDRQMRTVADDVSRVGAEKGFPAWHVEGRESGTWILLDFVDVVVHIFDRKHREYYELELIWGEAPRVRWRRARRTPPAEPT